MLRLALHPVDPPDTLKTRVETTLQELTDAAVDELEAWEIGAMRDPRNWVRPLVAGAVGALGGHGARGPARARAAQEARRGVERPARPHPPDRPRGRRRSA